ncbi:hypothetical protein Tco_0033481 [Tanacetum coccineum]
MSPNTAVRWSTKLHYVEFVMSISSSEDQSRERLLLEPFNWVEDLAVLGNTIGENFLNDRYTLALLLLRLVFLASMMVIFTKRGVHLEADNFYFCLGARDDV